MPISIVFDDPLKKMNGYSTLNPKTFASWCPYFLSGNFDPWTKLLMVEDSFYLQETEY
ncbi:hypothetical protein LWE69_09400 [Paenibacillus sp. UKAQ_18]|nr:hypothetical protein [Paenibacillus sp. UKAQ_18]